MNQESQITNHPRRIARNIAWSFTEKATEFGISFLIGIAVARYLGPASYGGLSIALILAGFFQRLTVGGTILTTSRQIAQSQSQGERMEWEASARKIVLGRSIGCTIAGFALAIFLPWEYAAPLAIALLAIPFNAGSCRFWALQTTLETKKTIVASRLSQIVGGATKLALLAFGAPGWLFAIASPVTEWTQTLWLTKGIKYPTPNPEKTKSLRIQAKNLRQSVLLKYTTSVLPNLGLGMVSATAAANTFCLSF